ncbi:hypothetical protein COCCADRAFT_100544 [Bipolaris zeicola 26-R-13]|uniref:Uncharacterized protein n=1 Tax=Cochliobolus carbonum (strain 26-R-13) TaxID=930089 RepID=W6XWG2_COCC2|nr:uncharacterized protein COCCADRAFT_100544 [Bipolaris zeicola 26-R-13]EUC31752.1 hypothetical protein COCCADRAFT_100544 [Bipolaris zeicola 26-R-13]
MHHPSLQTPYSMMIRHWAPTILDGYAFYGRPQKPRRTDCFSMSYMAVRTKLGIG